MPTLDDAIRKRQPGRFEKSRRILAHLLRSAPPSAVFRTSNALNYADLGHLGRTIRGTCRARYNQRPAILRRAL